MSRFISIVGILGSLTLIFAQEKLLDPKAWGGNHVGKPVPEYIHGDECLFCHRNDIGPGWQKNTHGVTIRQHEDAPDQAAILRKLSIPNEVASQVEYILGSRNRLRFLKKHGYGKFALLSTQAIVGPAPQAPAAMNAGQPVWSTDRFADRCAGCHTTAVDPATKSFSAFGIDCYTCHGDVTLNHTSDTSLIWLSKKRRKEGQAITSICAQCHLRLGKSRSSGLPYPNNFVAGDNLFHDFEVDFSKADDLTLNPGDRHVLTNVRDVVLYGLETPTCLSCHQVHGQSSSRHRFVLKGEICLQCHHAQGPMKAIKPYRVESPLCEY